VCGAEYELRAGAAYFAARDAGTVEAVEQSPAVDVLRLAALLGLTEAGARVGLCGRYGAAGEALELATEAACVLINAPSANGTSLDQLVVALNRSLPLERGTLAALAVDAANVALLDDATRVVRRGGRVVAPVSADVPAGCRELARDATEWVAEVETAGPDGMVRLRRGEGR
jgi:hypothetical protein